MKWLLLGISILWIASGALMVIYTDRSRSWTGRMAAMENIKWMSVIPLVFGLVLIVGAFYYREMLWLALTLGVVAVAKGVLVILWPEQRIRGIVEWWVSRAGEGTFRLLGLVTVVLGSALLSYLI